MLPNLLIIGAGKCGTTSLHAYLDAHPEFHMTHPKELGYFVKDDWSEPQRRAWYESHFARANGERYRGESCPAYAQHPFRYRTAERIHQTVPDAKLIYLVRDPIQRMQSQFYELRSQGLIGPWEEWAAGGWRRPDDRMMATSRYATQLRLYLEYFDAERILVLDHHDLLHRRDETLRRVFRWLEVDDTFQSPVFGEQHNTRGGKGTPRMPRWLWKGVVHPLSEKVPRRWREPIAAPARKLLLREITERAVIEGRLREQIAAELQPEVDWLREFTGQRFPSWTL